MKRLLFILILFPCLCFGQSRKGYLSIELGTYFARNTDPAIGVHLSGNAEITPSLFLGLEAGVIKFPNLKNLYAPILARFTMMPQTSRAKATPLILVEPGYGIYRHVRKIGNLRVETEGGFDFFGGIGAVFNGKGKGRLFLAIGYSSFGFSTNDIRSNLEMVGLRLGVMLR